MRRLVPLFLIVLAVAAVAFLFLRDGGDDAATRETPSTVEAAAAAGPDAAERALAGEAALERDLVEAPPAADAGAPPGSPPSFTSALSGLTGRVVDADLLPVPDLQVELLGGDLHSLLPAGAEFFGEVLPEIEPIVAAARTDAQGRFHFGAIDPHGLHVFLLDRRGPRATLRVCGVTPRPGQLADVGDLVLEGGGIVIGRVVDPEGAPVAGATVEVSFLPDEALRFALHDVLEAEVLAGRVPNGDFGQDGLLVLPVPPVARRFLDLLPRQATVTDAEGRFRLEALAPGPTTLLVRGARWPTLVRGPVPVKAAATVDLGDLALATGQDLAVSVVDGDDEPVAGAEVFAGARVPIWPAAALRRLGTTGEDGRLVAPGLEDREHIVAARAPDVAGFVVAQDQIPGLDEPVLRVGAGWSLHVTARGPDGAIVEHPAVAVQEASPFGDLMAVIPPLPIAARTTPQEDGSMKVTGLPAGRYVVRARREGLCIGRAEVEVAGGPAHVEVALGPAVDLEVAVVEAGTGAPVEWALVVASRADAGQLAFLAPDVSRRTDAAGRAVLADLAPGEVQVAVLHPAYARATRRATAPGEPVVVELRRGGAIAGTITRNGQPPGETMVVGAFPIDGLEHGLPRLAGSDAAGAYRIDHLQPGVYGVFATTQREMTGRGANGGANPFFSSSGGGEGRRGANFRMTIGSGGGEPDEAEETAPPDAGDDRSFRTPVVVVEGEETRHDFDVLGFTGTGPSGRLLGRVTWSGGSVEGLDVGVRRVGGGMARRTVQTDARGVFDFGQVRAGPLEIEVRHARGAGGVLAVRRETLAADGVREVEIVVETGSCAGRVVAARDGAPLPFASVTLTGEDLRLAGATGADGGFTFEIVPEGEYVLEARKAGFAPAFVVAVKVPPRGAPPPLRVELLTAVDVEGRVELPAGTSAPFLFLVFTPKSDGPPRSAEFTQADAQTGRFRVSGVAPGEVLVHLAASGLDLEPVELDVPPHGLTGAVLRFESAAPSPGDEDHD